MSRFRFIGHYYHSVLLVILGGLLVGLTAGGAVNAGPGATPPAGPGFRRVFATGDEAHLHLKTFMGSVLVRSGEKDRITVTADVPEQHLKIDQSGKIINIAALKEAGIRPITFVVTVPPKCVLSLQAFNSKVKVEGHSGDIEVVTYEGDIELADIRSDFVKAVSISGKIVFSGDLISGGRYQFDSMSDIDLWLPADESFDLVATSQQAHVDLGSFSLLNSKPGRRVMGRHREGGAKVQITSQSSIHFHRR